MHIQVSPDGRLNRDYTPFRSRPGLIILHDEYGGTKLLTVEKAREQWRSYIAQGWEWV